MHSRISGVTDHSARNDAHALEIARRVKARYAGCLVVCGGPHVPDHPDDFFTRYPQADVLVHGEGEMPFAGLLKALLEDQPDLGRLEGISYNRSGRCSTTPAGPRLGKDLPVFPSLISGVKALSKLCEYGIRQQKLSA